MGSPGQTLKRKAGLIVFHKLTMIARDSLVGRLVASRLGWASALGALLLFRVAAPAAAERFVFPNDPSVLDVKRDFGA
jgi:hypothetical protein